MQVVKKLFPYIIIVGLVVWAFGLTYTGVSILSQKTIYYGTYAWTYYEIDVKTWLQSIEHALADSSVMNVIPKEVDLPKAPNWSDVVSILKWAFNSLFIWITNCIIYGLNWVLVVPLKLIFYPLNIIYAIFGINTASEGWMYVFNQIYSFEIPQIPPI